MKEYKFRGFDSIGNKGWVYGDLVHNKRVDLTDRVMVGGYEVVPESVGISSGIKDKNGNEIFTGDIISIYDKEHDEYTNSEVLFRFGVIGVKNYTEYLTSLTCFVHIWNGKQLEDDEYEIEIVGNIMSGHKNI